MKIGDFLKDSSLSVGDNVSFLIEKLGMDKELLRNIELRIGESAKMSKSKANTVDPEEAIREFGSDTVRLYILFTAPPENDFEWSEEGIKGAYRFLNRLWDFIIKHAKDLRGISYRREDFIKLNVRAKEKRRSVQLCLDKYLRDMEKGFQFNTAIASAMELLNELSEFSPQNEEDFKVLKEGIEILLLMLSPMAPHICEELWSRIGKNNLIVTERLPEVDKDALVREEFEIAVQINGKVRGRIKVREEDDEDTIIGKIKRDEKLSKYIDGRNVKKIVYIKNKLVNVVL